MVLLKFNPYPLLVLMFSPQLNQDITDSPEDTTSLLAQLLDWLVVCKLVSHDGVCREEIRLFCVCYDLFWLFRLCYGCVCLVWLSQDWLLRDHCSFGDCALDDCFRHSVRAC